MPTRDELAPLIDAITECATTAEDVPDDRTHAETLRRVLYALWRIETRDQDGLKMLLEGLREA